MTTNHKTHWTEEIRQWRRTDDGREWQEISRYAQAVGREELPVIALMPHMMSQLPQFEQTLQTLEKSVDHDSPLYQGMNLAVAMLTAKAAETVQRMCDNRDERLFTGPANEE